MATLISTIKSRHGDFTIEEDIGAHKFLVAGPTSYSAEFSYEDTALTDGSPEQTTYRAAAYQNAVNTVNSRVKDLTDAQMLAVYQNMLVVMTAQQASIAQIEADVDKIQVDHFELKEDFKAVKVRAVTDELGVITRGVYGGWGSAIQRAIIVSALRDAKKLNAVIEEAQSPTSLPNDTIV